MNPLKAFHFTPTPVTIVLFLTYTLISSILLAIHFVPPTNLPTDEQQRRLGINVTEAWYDLQTITGFGYHPYNSHANDEVRSWLLRRIAQILNRNDATDVENSICKFGVKDKPVGICSARVDLVDDLSTNVTIPSSNGLSVHFQGTNIIVHIHGEDKHAAPVLVNAHYDSVSTGYGATDDGMGVVSVLQLISHFTDAKTPIRPRGLIALLNNGEEDFLNGAYAFAEHPISKLPRTFLNLEGAGAGGRATLFRTTDTEVTRFYKQVSRPFGSVLSDDGFKRRLIRSETDFKVFVEKLAMRGLDVAFWWPRSRYHTQEDDVAHSSVTSVWHMLSASITTLEGLMEYAGEEFDGEDGTAGKGTEAVWFDVFGRMFMVFKLRSAFIASVVLLIVPPLILLLTLWGLASSGKMYLFSNLPVASFRDISTRSVASAFRGWTTTRGWRGFTRYPISFVVGTGFTIAAAYLLNKVNPFIVYSNMYVAWAFYISVWLFVNIVMMKGADWWRPSALVRVYSWGWQFLGWWAAMVVVAVLQRQKHIAGVYFIPVFYLGSFFAAWLTLLEMFCLEPQYQVGDANTTSYYGTTEVYTPSEDTYSETNETCTEDTPLFHANRHGHGLQYSSSSRRPVLGNRDYSRRSRHTHQDGDAPCSEHSDDGRSEASSANEHVYGREQSWSAHLPQWTWLLEFFVAVPIPLVITEQLGIFTGTALSQTGADGSSVLTVHLMLAVFSIMLLLPTTPFLHRIRGLATSGLFVVLLGTGIYALTIFPFSTDSRLKVYFQQTVDVGAGTNKVALIGASPFVENITRHYIPSAIGKKVTCQPDERKVGLTACSWEGFMPNPVPGASSPSDWAYSSVNASTNHNPIVKSFSSRISVVPHNSRACKIFFTPNITNFYVHGTDSVTKVPPTKELRLWSRNWEEGWTVDVDWDQKEDVRTPKAQVVCLWSDANQNGVIPAFDEVKQFLPAWAIVSKAADGLVEAWM